MTAPPDQRFRFFTQSLPLISVCWLILLVIMGLRIYFTAVISEKCNKLETRNQELETQINNLAEQMQNVQTKWNELNVSRAQWSLDVYCPLRENVRVCQNCQEGWIRNEDSCEKIHDVYLPDWKTWDEAQEYCRGSNSHLAVIHNEKEKYILSMYSRGRSEADGYWIGLRVKDGNWKWLDGSNLTKSSWIEAPTDGHCAISVASRQWISVRCDDRHQWICKKNALF